MYRPSISNKHVDIEFSAQKKWLEILIRYLLEHYMLENNVETCFRVVTIENGVDQSYILWN